MCYGPGNAVQTIGLGGGQLLGFLSPGKCTVRDAQDISKLLLRKIDRFQEGLECGERQSSSYGCPELNGGGACRIDQPGRVQEFQDRKPRGINK